MADTTYYVVVDLSTRGSLATPVNNAKVAADQLNSALSNAGSTLGSLASKMSSAFTGAVESVGKLAGAATMGGLAAAVGAATYGVVGLNSELEKSTMSLAAIFNANGATSSIAGGMTLAADMMTRMRKDAAALPGEFSDLLGIFKMVQIPGLRAGSNPEELEKLSANIMAAGASAGLDMHMVAREAGQLLSGRAGSHNILGSTLFGLTGDEAGRFNAQSGEKRLAELTASMAKYQPAIELFSKSFDAQASALKDNTKKFLTDTTSPLFEKVKVELGRINGWFDDNGDLVSAWSGRIGNGLATAFDWGVKKIEEWWPAIQKFAVDAFAEVSSIWERVEPIVARVASHIKDALADKSAIGMIENVLRLYAVVKVGGGVLGGLGGVGGVMSMAGGAASAAGVVGEGAAVAAIGTAGAVAAVGILEIASAIDVLNDTNAPGHNIAFDSWAQTKENLDAAELAAKNAGLTIEHHLIPGLTRVGDLAGVVGILALQGWSASMEFGTEHLDAFASAVGVLSPNLSLALTALLQFDEAVKQIGRTVETTGIHGIKFNTLTKATSMATKGGGAGGGGTTIHKVEINVASNQDTARIAKFTFDNFEKLRRNPTSASGVRNWSNP